MGRRGPSRSPTPCCCRRAAASPPPSVVAKRSTTRSAMSAAFSKLRKPRNWSRKNREGATVGEKFDPLERVGIYVPGGTAPLVSTALMTVPLAKEAGVREIVVTTPPPVNETLLYALRTAGRDGDLSRWAARRPSRRWPTARRASRACRRFSGPATPSSSRPSGRWSARSPSTNCPGRAKSPSSADETARADFIAADLLAQAEHGSGSQVLFVTPSAKLLAAVESELAKQVPKLLARQAPGGGAGKRLHAHAGRGRGRGHRHRGGFRAGAPDAWSSRTRASGPRTSAMPARFSSAITRRSPRVISSPAPATSCPPAARPRRFPA